MLHAYLTALYDLAVKDRRVLSLIADSGTGYDLLFKRDLPDQFYDFGISEQNMVAAAAGLASEGYVPFAFAPGAFLAYRSHEFIRLDCCLQKRNVKLIGMGSGVSWSTLGPTHHTTEDIACLRSLPGLTIFSPSTPAEAAETVKAAYALEGPVYIRLGMTGEPELFRNQVNFRVGRNAVLREGKDIAVFATGSIVAEVLKAAERLEADGISAAVHNVSSLKPFDAFDVLDCAKRYARIYTVEEHNVCGGLGDAVAAVLAGSGCTCPLTRIGLADVFASGYGTEHEVRAANGLDAESLAGRMRIS